jgi:membrane-associated phospholipid phosphatase
MLWLSLSLLIVTTFVAANLRMSSPEQAVFDILYHILQPFNPALLIVTQLGSLAMWLVSVVVAFAAKQRRVALQLALSGGLAILLTVLLKSLVARPRPFDALEAITHYDRLASGYGYPSGHTAIAVCMALVLWTVFPRSGRWLLLALAAIVAFSRIGLGVHAPLDIVGGALIGFITVRLVQKLYPLKQNL